MSRPPKAYPYKIMSMEVTQELEKQYEGTEELLKYRAVFPPHCFKAFDAVRLCMMQKLDHHTCTEVYQAFAPCADEMAARRASALREREERERKAKLEAAAAANKAQKK